MKYRRQSILLFIIIATLFVSGCSRNYTVSGERSDEAATYDERAIQEENDAVDNAPVLSDSGMSLWKTVEQRTGMKYSYDKTEDTVTMMSDDMEIVAGGQRIGVIYFTLYDEYPLQNDEIKNKLFAVIQIISDFLGIPYNEAAVIDSLTNIDHSADGNSKETNYCDNVDLFSCIWNNGLINCVDFRIIPEK